MKTLILICALILASCLMSGVMASTTESVYAKQVNQYYDIVQAVEQQTYVWGVHYDVWYVSGILPQVWEVKFINQYGYTQTQHIYNGGVEFEVTFANWYTDLNPKIWMDWSYDKVVFDACIDYRIGIYPNYQIYGFVMNQKSPPWVLNAPFPNQQ